MNGFSYPQPIFRSPIYNPAFYLSLDASGYLTYDYAQTLYFGKNDYRLTYITGITPGTATPGVALAIGSDGGLSGLGAVSCSSLTVSGSSIVSAPAYVQSITPGTAANSKALVLDSSGAIGTIVSPTATSIAGTLQTAAQTNITSLGTLTGLTVGGNITLSGTSRVLALTGAGSYIDSTSFRQGGVAYDISLVSRLSLTTLGVAEASKAIVLDSSRSVSNIYAMTLDSGGTGLNIPALSFGGIVFNQNYYISITEGSAAVSKALITNASKDISGLRNLSCTGALTASTSIASPLLTTDQIAAGTTGRVEFIGATSYLLINNTANSSSSVSGALRCMGGIYAGGNSFFEKAITFVDGYRLVRTPAQPYITSVGTLTSLTTTCDRTCGGLVNGFVGYGNQSNITTVGRLTELAIGSTGTSNEYLSIRGSGLDYLDGSYTRMMRCYGSNANAIEFQIEINNGSSGTSTNAVFIGTRTSNDLRFGTGDATTLILTTTGRLGLGTTSPSVPLHIPGTATVSYGSGSTMVYRLRTDSGVTEMALGPISYSTSAIFGGYIACQAMVMTSDQRLKRDIQSCPLDRIKILYDSCSVKLYNWIPSEKRQGQEISDFVSILVG